MGLPHSDAAWQAARLPHAGAHPHHTTGLVGQQACAPPVLIKPGAAVRGLFHASHNWAVRSPPHARHDRCCLMSLAKPKPLNRSSPVSALSVSSARMKLLSEGSYSAGMAVGADMNMHQ